jgi:hypothetical protein
MLTPREEFGLAFNEDCDLLERHLERLRRGGAEEGDNFAADARWFQSHAAAWRALFGAPAPGGKAGESVGKK